MLTVIFFGYIGKLALITVGAQIDLEVNADHNFIGLCFLASFVVLITAADFVIQDASFNSHFTAIQFIFGC